MTNAARNLDESSEHLTAPLKEFVHQPEKKKNKRVKKSPREVESNSAADPLERFTGNLAEVYGNTVNWLKKNPPKGVAIGIAASVAGFLVAPVTRRFKKRYQ